MSLVEGKHTNSLEPSRYSDRPGSASGGATVKQPTGGFNATALSQVFSHTVARYVAPTSSSSTTSNQPSNSSSPGTSSTPSSAPVNPPWPLGPAVGGAVGGVALIAIVGFVLFRLRARRRRNSQDNEWEKAELSGTGARSSAQNMPVTQEASEVTGDTQWPRYELDGNYQGVEASSEPILPRRTGAGGSPYSGH